MVIGITGGIGSGKTTVTNIFVENGFCVLLADKIAKNIMNENHDISNKIVNIFGNECYVDGKLIPKVLANKVFNHPEKISILNSIVHPPTIAKIKDEIELNNKNHKIVLVEVPLLFEANMVDLFDFILLVTSDIDTRIRRVLERDNNTAAEIKGRIEAQLPEDQKRGRSDFVIENNSSIDQLREKTLFFLNLFKSLNPS